MVAMLLIKILQKRIPQSDRDETNPSKCISSTMCDIIFCIFVLNTPVISNGFYPCKMAMSRQLC